MIKMKPFGAALFLFIAATIQPAYAGTWQPVQIYEWRPAFNTEGKRELKEYAPITGTAQKNWRICVSIPHLKDAYWLGVNYGLVDEAEALDVSMSIYEAGGYEPKNLAIQIQQIENCLDKGIDALIVSAISLNDVNGVLAKAHAAGIPVIDLINGVSFSDLAARSAADFYDNGFETGRYLVNLHRNQSHDATVLWFPGPENAGWSQRGDAGFRDAVQDSKIKILATAYGDTGKRTQGKLVEDALKQHPDVDFIVGTAVTAEAATSILRREHMTDRTQILAYYFGPGVYRGITRGTILAAPSDIQAIQARIAVDQAIRILEQKPLMKHVGPKIKVIDKSNLEGFDLSTSLAPRGFKAIFDVN